MVWLSDQVFHLLFLCIPCVQHSGLFYSKGNLSPSNWFLFENQPSYWFCAWIIRRCIMQPVHTSKKSTFKGKTENRTIVSSRKLTELCCNKKNFHLIQIWPYVTTWKGSISILFSVTLGNILFGKISNENFDVLLFFFFFWTLIYPTTYFVLCTR